MKSNENTSESRKSLVGSNTCNLYTHMRLTILVLTMVPLIGSETTLKFHSHLQWKGYVILWRKKKKTTLFIFGKISWHLMFFDFFEAGSLGCIWVKKFGLSCVYLALIKVYITFTRLILFFHFAKLTINFHRSKKVLVA